MTDNETELAPIADGWTLADHCDAARIAAKAGKSITYIAKFARVTVETATMFWSQANPNSQEARAGLKRTTVDSAEWLMNCKRELCRPVKEEDQ